MKANPCPVCQGDEFFDVGMVLSYGAVYIRFGMFRWADVKGKVCLGCGFVAPYVDGRSLDAIRRKAGWQGDRMREKPSKQAFVEI
jgi:hypothetical protein